MQIMCSQKSGIIQENNNNIYESAKQNILLEKEGVVVVVGVNRE